MGLQFSFLEAIKSFICASYIVVVCHIYSLIRVQVYFREMASIVKVLLSKVSVGKVLPAIAFPEVFDGDSVEP